MGADTRSFLDAGASPDSVWLYKIGSIDPVGIWKAWTTKVITKKTKTAVSAISSKY